jgi:hypothetical protein
VVDPYNEIEHWRPPNMNETEYVSQLLGKVKRFAQSHGVHVWTITHPVKMQRENGKLPADALRHFGIGELGEQRPTLALSCTVPTPSANRPRPRS